MTTTDPGLPSAPDVLAYWRALGPKRWFANDDAIDAEIREKFRDLHAAAAAGMLSGRTNSAAKRFLSSG